MDDFCVPRVRRPTQLPSKLVACAALPTSALPVASTASVLSSFFEAAHAWAIELVSALWQSSALHSASQAVDQVRAASALLVVR